MAKSRVVVSYTVYDEEWNKVGVGSDEVTVDRDSAEVVNKIQGVHSDMVDWLVSSQQQFIDRNVFIISKTPPR